MRRYNIILFFCIIYSLYFLISCKTIEKKDNLKDNKDKTTNYQNKQIEKENKVKEKIKAMSIIEKRGLLTMVSIPGYELTEDTVSFLNKNKIKGVILFKYNIKNENQLKKLTNDLREKIDNNILIAIDQEGGKIVRIDWEETAKISPTYISSKNSEDFAYQVAYKRGTYLKTLGINMVLAPVADIPSNKNDFIFERSFGIDKETVCKLIKATVKGYKDSGIICVLKHFPGHGKTKVDSHYEFPIINKKVEDLKNDDLLPFIAGIEAGANMIMIGHIINSFIDEKLPASLSYKYVNLLNELNFQGVIITDDLSMTGKINKGIGWGINVITGKKEYIQNIIDTIQPIDEYVEKVVNLIYFREETKSIF